MARKSSRRSRELPFTARVRSQGRVTIPEPVRRALDIVEGDVVHIKIRKVEGGSAPAPPG